MNHTDALATELGNAFTAALEFVADLRDARPNEVREDATLRDAVWAETLAMLACRPGVGERLAERFAPTRCGREGCVNDADNEIRHPRRASLVFCSGPCRDWYRREEARKVQARQCMGRNCTAQAGARRVFCGPKCRERFPANRDRRELVAA